MGGKYPELDDDKGTSLILINTDKGKAMLKEIEASTYQHECALQHAIEGNPSLISSVKIPRAREKFFKDLQIRDFNYIINKYMSAPSAMEKKLLFAKRALRYVKKRIMNSIKV